MKKLRTILLATVAALLLPLSAGAGTGLTEISAAARQGDAEAQLELGILYEFGYGMADNQIAALAWYILAAQQGHAKAAVRRDILKKRLPQSDIDKAGGMSARLLGNKPAVAKVSDAPKATEPASEK